MNRTHLEFDTLEAAKGTLADRQALVGANSVFGAARFARDIGPDHIDPIEGGLVFDVPGLALVVEALVGDGEFEVLGPFVLVDGHAYPELRCTAQIPGPFYSSYGDSRTITRGRANASSMAPTPATR